MQHLHCSLAGRWWRGVARRLWLRRALSCLWLLAGVLLAMGSARAAASGDILIVDQSGGILGLGAVVVVDPLTGDRTILSDFGDPAQGQTGKGGLTSVAVRPTGEIFVSSLFEGYPDGGAVFQVDPLTGNRTMVANFGHPPQGYLYYGLAVDLTGRILVNSQGGKTAGVVALKGPAFARVPVSDISVPGKGEVFGLYDYITDLAVEPPGHILIGAAFWNEVEQSARSALFRVHPTNGKRLLLSDFTDPAQGVTDVDLAWAAGLAVDAGGDILVNTSESPDALRNVLLRVDPESGHRTILSDFDDPAQGPLGYFLHGLGIELSGDLLVVCWTVSADGGFPSAVFRVNPVTGQRWVLSDSLDPAQGPPLRAPTYIAIMP